MKILLVLFIFIYNSINIVQSESNFTKGFNAGYSQFFCRNVSNCNLKIPEVTKHNPELSTFRDGFELGKIQGAADRLKLIHGSDYESVVGFSQLREINSEISFYENKQLYFIQPDIETAFKIASASKILIRAGKTDDQYGPISQQHKLLVARYKSDYRRYQRDNSVKTSSSGPTNIGIGPIKNLTFRKLNPAIVKAGENTFKQKCTACHAAERKLIGPALKDIYKKRRPEWVVNLLLNTTEMLKKDPDAIALLKEYNNIMMLNQNLSEKEAISVAEYLRTL
jgi:hypothetical protein